jgi:hypothetical protein
MYSFQRINHGLILTHAVLAGLTPLIPVPFLDDWVKAIFLRRMVRQLGLARGLNFSNEAIEGLLQEDFWDGCLDGCIGIFLRLLREIFSKIFFWIEWRRALNTLSITYYTGFLLDAALLDGWPGAPHAANAPAATAAYAATAAHATPIHLDPAVVVHLREAVRRARYGANLKLIQHLLRPGDLLAAAWTLVRRSLSQLPRMLAALWSAFWQGLRSTPGAVVRGVTTFPRRVREIFYLRVQVLLGREKAPELLAVERLVHSMQAALLKIDPDYFDSLHARLVTELNRPASPAP